jgi:monoamine oxidase
MAARELARAGVEVTILEARNRMGGRIHTLDEREFGYPAQGGAEFVHGASPLTESLCLEAGLTLVPREGEVWFEQGGKLSPNIGPAPGMDIFRERLGRLQEDMTIADFLDVHLAGESYVGLRKTIERMVEGYDAADPKLASSFALRDEWSSDGFGQNRKILEGYGAFVDFLQSECKKYCAEIRLSSDVKSIDLRGNPARLTCRDGETYEAAKVVLTVPPPLLSQIAVLPALPEKMAAARMFGFGAVIKILLKFETRWWTAARDQDLSRMFLVRSQEVIPVWWTQYPQTHPVLTGWLSGPRIKSYVDASAEEIVELGIACLAKSLGASKSELRQMLVASKVINWRADAYARGAYTYATLATREARAELLRPVDDVLFFSGEALFEGKEIGTVEAALASGLAAARRVMGGA